ncbi:bifunctional Orotate phosphoribosyltransferase/Phosphoribosyltransferase-like/Orotate phosphoribosyl transferase domain/Phosphoribosyltransferase domain [Babesia duncani]|uniref:orotate phosphoribosyltransferase n=1 Tax=Babesia duncani TaxID=323732 RepID=A0AAD9UPN2_9APIC|nr:bifunctional Orotate phosphoribosyltransferase/Phosphoribosyltransferase-like/Orotate phosphoribosyl transferase domain/Phosphoribosyltransferase domain [Babesia duncani]
MIGDLVPVELKQKLIERCKQQKAIHHGKFVLNCGIESNVYFNSGILTDAQSFSLLCDVLVTLLVNSKIEFDAIIGLPYKSIPIAAQVCVGYFERTGKNVSFGYHRKEVKDHGEGSLYVGAPNVFAKGTKVVILDDVLTSGKALYRALDLLEPLGLDIVAFVVIINREVEYGGL